MEEDVSGNNNICLSYNLNEAALGKFWLGKWYSCGLREPAQGHTVPSAASQFKEV